VWYELAVFVVLGLVHKGGGLVLDYLASACWGAAVALLLDEAWDYHKLGRGFLKASDLLNPRSHEFIIVVLTALGVALWLS